MRLTLSGENRPTSRYEWIDQANDSEANDGWATAVVIRGTEGWSCELRVAGGTSDREFSSPAGLVRLLAATAAHFAKHPEQVLELVDSRSTGRNGVGVEQRKESRAA